MTQMRECKRCLLEDLLEEQTLYAMIQERISLLSEGERASGAEYDRRLVLCRSCDQLSSGTCMQCGCYVELRAAKRGMHCAHCHPKW